MKLSELKKATLNNLVIFYDDIFINLPGYKPEISNIYIYFEHLKIIKKWFEKREKLTLVANQYYPVFDCIIISFDIKSNKDDQNKLIKIELKFLANTRKY